MQVSFRPITASNWKACCALELFEQQQGFLPSNLYSIAEAQFYPESFSKAVYSNEVLVGYILWGKELTTGDWKLFRLMIDKNTQGKGIGKAAMQLLIEELLQKHHADALLVSYQKSNLVASKFYEKLGFKLLTTDKTKLTAKLELS